MGSDLISDHDALLLFLCNVRLGFSVNMYILLVVHEFSLGK